MAIPRPEHLVPFVAPPAKLAALDSGGNELRLAFRWGLEAALARARWVVLLACLPLLPLLPPSRWPGLALVALSIGLGNAAVIWLLRQAHARNRLRTTRRLATALDWGGALGLIGLFSDESALPTRSLLLLALLTTGVRYGRRGLVGGGLAAGLVMGLLIGVQTQVFGVLEPPRVPRLVLSDALLLSVTSLVLGSLLRAATTWRRWHEERRTADDSALARLKYSLSERESELLPLLAREDLTYAQIGARLAISPSTVRTHERRLGDKLGGVHERRAVVRAATDAGLLPAKPGVTGIQPSVDTNSSR